MQSLPPHSPTTREIACTAPVRRLYGDAVAQAATRMAAAAARPPAGGPAPTMGAWKLPTGPNRPTGPRSPDRLNAPRGGRVRC